jgi:hypothetical protein
VEARLAIPLQKAHARSQANEMLMA